MNADNEYRWGKAIIAIVGLSAYASIFIGVLLVILQLLGEIHCSWITVLLPIIIPFVVEIILSAIFGIFMIFIIAGDKRKNAKKKEIGH